MGGIGDQLCATAVMRELKRRLPAENLRIFEPYHPEIWRGNPYMNTGNHENGVRMHLDSPAGGERIAEHYADKIARKLKMAPLPVADDTPELFLTEQERQETFGLSPNPRSVAINGEAGWATRRWAYFADLAKMLMGRGWAVYHVGHDDSKPLPCTRSFFRQLTVRQTAVLLTRVARVVCNDTGLMHLAAAVGTPCVATFGHIPGSERMYRTTRTTVGCAQRCMPKCGYTQCKYSPRCAKLDKVPAREVFSEVVR